MVVPRSISTITQCNPSFSLINSMLMVVFLYLAKMIQQIVEIYLTLALNGLRVIPERECYVLIEL